MNVYVFTNPPRLSLIAVPKVEGGVYLFAEDVNVAEACAEQFYSEAMTRLQTLEPSGSPLIHPSDHVPAPPCRVLSYVARANAVPLGTPSVVDLMELESRIMAKCDPSSVAIFEPDEYAGLIWLDLVEEDAELKTLVFPSGAIVLHGPNWDRMEELLRRKIPLIQKCMLPIPESLKQK